jgi:hypothetical protein
MAKRSQKSLDAESPKMTLKKEQIKCGAILWSSTSWGGKIQACHGQKGVINGGLMVQFVFCFKGCKKKLGPNDSLDALAVKGKTNFTGYDSLYQAALIQNHEQN